MPLLTLPPMWMRIQTLEKTSTWTLIRICRTGVRLEEAGAWDADGGGGCSSYEGYEDGRCRGLGHGAEVVHFQRRCRRLFRRRFHCPLPPTPALPWHHACPFSCPKIRPPTTTPSESTTTPLQPASSPSISILSTTSKKTTGNNDRDHDAHDIHHHGHPATRMLLQPQQLLLPRRELQERDKALRGLSLSLRDGNSRVSTDSFLAPCHLPEFILVIFVMLLTMHLASSTAILICPRVLVLVV
ncbi:hypothetical protein K439DRAFT_979104 [Ramaria rubella]|nr:hypothetical protein K439DRAFT_979104 [Ramaria rubella]